jgi:[ribosomal protein S18]-alanine N-acetyltransferase
MWSNLVVLLLGSNTPTGIEGTESMSKMASIKQTVHIRWMIRRDLPSVMGIESASFEFPWTEDEFVRCLRQRDCIGMVAEYAEQVVGFMIYEMQRTRIHVLSFAVHPDYRRQSVGSAMVQKLVSKLAYQRRNRIILEVRETNLAAQLFFKSLGFRATGVLRNFYEDSTEDAFLMQFRSMVSDASEDMHGDTYRGLAG